MRQFGADSDADDNNCRRQGTQGTHLEREGLSHKGGTHLSPAMCPAHKAIQNEWQGSVEYMSIRNVTMSAAASKLRLPPQLLLENCGCRRLCWCCFKISAAAADDVAAATAATVAAAASILRLPPPLLLLLRLLLLLLLLPQ